MKTSTLFDGKKVLSFEIFPPKQPASIDVIYDTVAQLKELEPDFISVTYGATGGGARSKTVEIASTVKNIYGIESVAHLPGINLSKSEVLGLVSQFEEQGIKNILALRGDVNPNIPAKGDFKYASDLIAFIKEQGDFNIIGACYPEGHVESGGIIKDIQHLKAKVDAGTDQLITQLFFDNDYFYSFRERATIAGINTPIQAGIMPVVNKKQIERMVDLCGVDLPKKFLTMMERYQDNPIAMREAGIAYAIDQIVDLITQGVDGIHLYTMNKPDIAYRIYQAINKLLVA